MQASPLLSVSPNSPSFNTDSSSVDLAQIAARVVEELRLQEESHPDEWLQPEPYHTQGQGNGVGDGDGEDKDEDEDEDDFEFEFSMVRGGADSGFIVTADEIFHNGRIRPMYPYPLFYSDFSFGGGRGPDDIGGGPGVKEPGRTPRQRSPLRKLMSEEREAAAAVSSSSSEADDDLVGVPPESYCLWKPGRAEGGADPQSSPSRWKIKSFSTGSSKRWKLRDLLYLRSSSDGKEAFLFLSSNKRTDRSRDRKTSGESKPQSSPAEEDRGNCTLYARNNCGRSPTKDGEAPKRRSYLPYRKDLVGIFSNVNGLSRNLHPF